MITRRQFLKGLAAVSAGTAAFGGYAFAEPFRLSVTRYQITPENWPAGLKLRLAVIADVHCCEPWMPASRVRQIVARTNALAPDATLLLGDYVSGRMINKYSTRVPHKEWAGALGGLRAPLGVHAVLGNHDWWDDADATRKRKGPVASRVALEDAGIAVYENNALKLEKESRAFWLAGLGDQRAFYAGRGKGRIVGGRKTNFDGTDDLPATLAKITGDDPVVLMAHEPDIFPEVPGRVALTLSGHTHGGQVRLLGYSPIVPSEFGRRYAYGHIVEEGRHLVVSGGLGCGALPIRLGVPPEIVLVELG